jgi:hypothetical protein
MDRNIEFRIFLDRNITAGLRVKTLSNKIGIQAVFGNLLNIRPEGWEARMLVGWDAGCWKAKRHFEAQSFQAFKHIPMSSIVVSRMYLLIKLHVIMQHVFSLKS